MRRFFYFSNVKVFGTYEYIFFIKCIFHEMVDENAVVKAKRRGREGSFQMFDICWAMSLGL
jgi:hypothetical protein